MQANKRTRSKTKTGRREAKFAIVFFGTERSRRKAGRTGKKTDMGSDDSDSKLAIAPP